MKKLVILALVAILLPSIAQAQTPGIKQGDPAMYGGHAYYDFPGGTIELVEGEWWCHPYAACNFAYSSGTCQDPMDTFAVVADDLFGWPIVCGLQDYGCFILNDSCSTDPCYGDWGWAVGDEVCIQAPCPSVVGQINTLSVSIYYCDASMTAQPDSGDCEDPNIRAGEFECWQTVTQEFEIIAPAPALVIEQDTLYLIEEGLAAAYVPFSICNGDLCAGTGDYDWVITSQGTIGAAINQSGTAEAVAPGDCQDIYAVIDAGAAEACDWDTLTILGWDVATGEVYDTCVLPIHVVEPVPVPLFTAPVVTILVLAMILAAAVIMKRHAVSKV